MYIVNSKFESTEIVLIIVYKFISNPKHIPLNLYLQKIKICTKKCLENITETNLNIRHFKQICFKYLQSKKQLL